MTGGCGCDATLPGSQPPSLPRQGSRGPWGGLSPSPSHAKRRPASSFGKRRPQPGPRTHTALGGVDVGSGPEASVLLSDTQTESRGAGGDPRRPRQSQPCSEDHPASVLPWHKAGPLPRPQHSLWGPCAWWGSPRGTRRPLTTYLPTWLSTNHISHLKPPGGDLGARLVTAARPASRGSLRTHQLVSSFGSTP